MVPPGAADLANEVSLTGGGPEWRNLVGSFHLAFADVRSPSGTILVGAAGDFAAAADPFDIVIARLGSVSAQLRQQGTIYPKLRLRIERVGWRSFAGKGRAKSRNGHLRILEIGVDTATAPPVPPIELEAYAPGDRRTGWKAAGEAAGFPEGDTPLTGFAARLATADPDDGLSIGYSGEFREAGTVAACFDGKPCRSPIADDPLVGVSLWIGRRSPA